MSDVFRPKAVSVRVKNWFKRFQSVHFYVNDAFRSGRPIMNKRDIFEKVKHD